jgi:hypothetical protein
MTEPYDWIGEAIRLVNEPPKPEPEVSNVISFAEWKEKLAANKPNE